MSDALCFHVRPRELWSTIRSHKLTLRAETRTNAATKALPATTVHSPTLRFSAAPVVVEAVAAVPVVKAVVFELSVPLAFEFAPVYLVAVTPVPLVHGPGRAVEGKTMSAHCSRCVRDGAR